MIDFNNLPGVSHGTLVAVNIKRDPSGDLAWDLDVAYQLANDPQSSHAIEHALPGASILVEEGLTSTRKVTVSDSTERDDVRVTLTSVDTGEEVIAGAVAEIRNIVLRVKNDAAFATVRYRLRGTADQFAPVLRYLDARVKTEAEAVQVALPFPSKIDFAPVDTGDLVTGLDVSGVLTSGIVVDVRTDNVDVEEMSGMVVRVMREGMAPPIKIASPGFGSVEKWVENLKKLAKVADVTPTWGEVICMVGNSYMLDRNASRGDSGEFLLDSSLIAMLVTPEAAIN